MKSPKYQDEESFEHMLTVLMIGFGDARALDDEGTRESSEEAEKINRDMFDYAQSWLEAHGGTVK